MRIDPPEYLASLLFLAMLLCAPLFVSWLITNTLSTPLHHTRHASRSLPKLDRQAALARRAATRRKFQNAHALLTGVGTSTAGYTISSALENTYDRASDYVTNISRLTSLLGPSSGQPFYPPSAIRVAAAAPLSNTNGTTVDSLQDDTDGVDDYEYYGLIAFGSQAQPLQMDFDTGSADLWVPVNCSDCGGLSSFQASASLTFLNTNSSFHVAYGLGSVTGTLAEDTVSVGQFKVYNQTIGAVRSVTQNFADSPNDGLVGMAFGTIANSHRPTLFENLISQLQAPLFSVYFTRNQVHGSEIYLGGIDASKAGERTVRWVPTYWTVGMTAASVNDTRVETGTVSAIIDTGTSFIYLPTHVITAIYKLIPGAVLAPDYGDGFYAYPCDAPTTVSFVLGPHTLALDPRDLNLGLYASDTTSRTCVAALVDAGSGFDFAILGDSFLKSYVSIFDYSNGARVGFVKSINE